MYNQSLAHQFVAQSTVVITDPNWSVVDTPDFRLVEHKAIIVATNTFWWQIDLPVMGSATKYQMDSNLYFWELLQMGFASQYLAGIATGCFVELVQDWQSLTASFVFAGNNFDAFSLWHYKVNIL